MRVTVVAAGQCENWLPVPFDCQQHPYLANGVSAGPSLYEYYVLAHTNGRIEQAMSTGREYFIDLGVNSHQKGRKDMSERA